MNASVTLPKHIAIIMDGNGRWAKQRLQPRFMGHRVGVKSVEAVVKRCGELNIEALSLFAFSSENWRRPGKEVSLLMDLFSQALTKQVIKLNENNIRLRVIGDASRFSEKLQKEIQQGEALTENNTGLTLNIAANYGGRWDVTQSIQQLAKQVASGEIKPEDIDEAAINNYLSIAGLPEPDLFIRTGGEKRISNFLLWQLAYTELYFTDVLWPDFGAIELDKAIDSFGARERRFGRTSEQIQKTSEPNA